jgi:hypothetical protein
MIELEEGVIDYVQEEAKSQGLKHPVVLIMDCGCILSQETVELDIQEIEKAKGYEFYMEAEGVNFFISPKVRHLADSGKIVIESYGAGRFKRLAYHLLPLG